MTWPKILYHDTAKQSFYFLREDPNSSKKAFYANSEVDSLQVWLDGEDNNYYQNNPQELKISQFEDTYHKDIYRMSVYSPTKKQSFKWPTLLVHDNGEVLQLSKNVSPRITNKTATYTNKDFPDDTYNVFRQESGRFIQDKSRNLTGSKSGKLYESFSNLHSPTKIKTQENNMSQFANGSKATAIAEDVKTETTDVAKITLGRILYTNSIVLIAGVVPQLKWYEKLFTSAKKRELAVLISTYVAIKVLQQKYDHYMLQCVSSYINFQLQAELLGGIPEEAIQKLFTKFEKVD